VNALPLRLRSHVLGSLNLFHAGTAGLGGGELQLVQALTAGATIAILQQRTTHRSEVVARRLQAALTSRIIEQAKGVLAERLQISADNAFEVPRGAAGSPTGCYRTWLARSPAAAPRSPISVPARREWPAAWIFIKRAVTDGPIRVARTAGRRHRDRQLRPGDRAEGRYRFLPRHRTRP
jgi:hypothetical protein